MMIAPWCLRIAKSGALALGKASAAKPRQRRYHSIDLAALATLSTGAAEQSRVIILAPSLNLRRMCSGLRRYDLVSPAAPSKTLSLHEAVHRISAEIVC